jgi:hypothetical protein
VRNAAAAVVAHCLKVAEDAVGGGGMAAGVSAGVSAGVRKRLGVAGPGAVAGAAAVELAADDVVVAGGTAVPGRVAASGPAAACCFVAAALAAAVDTPVRHETTTQIIMQYAAHAEYDNVSMVHYNA